MTDKDNNTGMITVINVIYWTYSQLLIQMTEYTLICDGRLKTNYIVQH